MPIPSVPSLAPYVPALVGMVTQTSLLPNPEVVRSLGGAVFPTQRYRSGHRRLSHILQNGEPIGMYDDNATPEWAIFWAHGRTGTRPKGWTIAHVWPAGEDIAAYTHAANLLMVPEPFASLTDKTGPLTCFLRWHAWTAYTWKPAAEAEPQKPLHYDEINWRYLPMAPNPGELIRQRLAQLNNERVRILQPLMNSPRLRISA
jgi:hypothetical protein